MTTPNNGAAYWSNEQYVDVSKKFNSLSDENRIGYTRDGCLHHRHHRHHHYDTSSYISQSVADAVAQRYDQNVVKCTVSDNKCYQQSAMAKPHSTPVTLQWLKDNYELADGVCIPRCLIYSNYLEFTGNNYMQAVNSASFGKIIRQQFPLLTTRRLGTRGQSKYHYYGLAVKDTSPYYDGNYAKKYCNAVNNKSLAFNIKDEHTSKQNRYNMGPTTTTAQDIKTTLKRCSVTNQNLSVLSSSSTRRQFSYNNNNNNKLSDFPQVCDLKLPPFANKIKVGTLLMMYKVHCERIVDALSRPSFDELENYIVHFWQGMPTHMFSMFGNNYIVNVVGICDVVLYKSICRILVPTFTNQICGSANHAVVTLLRGLEKWISFAMHGLPDNLRRIKLKLARRFCQSLHRKSSLNHLCQSLHQIIQNQNLRNQLYKDWNQINVEEICSSVLLANNCLNRYTINIINKWMYEFGELLHQATSVEFYTRWLKNIAHNCILQNGFTIDFSTNQRASRFLLLWNGFSLKIIRDIALTTSSYFGSFSALKLMCDEYATFLTEEIISEEINSELMRGISSNEIKVQEEQPSSSAKASSGGIIDIHGTHAPCGSSAIDQHEQENCINSYGPTLQQYYEETRDVVEPLDVSNSETTIQTIAGWSPDSVTEPHIFNDLTTFDSSSSGNSLDLSCCQAINTQPFQQRPFRVKYQANRSHQCSISAGSGGGGTTGSTVAGTLSNLHETSEYEYSSYIYEETSTAVIYCPTNAAAAASQPYQIHKQDSLEAVGILPENFAVINQMH